MLKTTEKKPPVEETPKPTLPPPVKKAYNNLSSTFTSKQPDKPSFFSGCNTNENTKNNNEFSKISSSNDHNQKVITPGPAQQIAEKLRKKVDNYKIQKEDIEDMDDVFYRAKDDPIDFSEKN